VAEKPQLQIVKVPAGADDVTFRLPTDAEAARLGISGGTWLAVVVKGDRTDVYPIDRTRLRFG